MAIIAMIQIQPAAPFLQLHFIRNFLPLFYAIIT